MKSLPYQNEIRTAEMFIPNLADDECFFVSSKMPGTVLAGTADHVRLMELYGYQSSEIACDQAILMLNSYVAGTTCKFERLPPLTRDQLVLLDVDIPIIWDSDEILKEE